MREQTVLSPSEFQKGYQAFQEREARDAMYKTASFLVNHFWGQPRDMADSLGILLLTWNQAFYRYGSFDFGCLEDTLKAHMDALEKLRQRGIQSFNTTDESVVRQLFTAFLDALCIKEGSKKGCKSPVAVAKALHLLAPAYFPLWDDKIARAYGCHYKPHPEKKYIDFAYQMRQLASELESSVPASSGRTFLKLIDEYNYAKYTKNWI